MIYAQHNFWAEFIFQYYITWLVKRHFHKIHIYGDIPQIDRDLPILILPTHSNWWDGFFVYLLNKKYYEKPLYLMMLEEQLKKYGFFTKIGAYSVAPENPKKVLKSLNYTVSLLRQHNPYSSVCIFPQGELQPWHLKPLNLKRGVDWIVTKYQGTIQIILMAAKIQYLNHQHPDVFVMFKDLGEINQNNFGGISHIKRNLEELKSSIDEKIVSEETGKIFLNGSKSINEMVEKSKFKRVNTNK